MKRVCVSLVVVLFMACGGSGGSGGSEESPDAGATTHQLTVEVAEQEPACLSFSGTPVTVRDANNSIIGSSTLPAPEREPNTDAYQGRLFGDTILVSSTSLEVDDSDFYQVEVEGVPGAVTFRKAELEANGWKAEMVCG